jgi:hypothetical protein
MIIDQNAQDYRNNRLFLILENYLYCEVTRRCGPHKPRRTNTNRIKPMALLPHTDKTTNKSLSETWSDADTLGRPSTISPECLDRYLQNARHLRANAFRELFRGRKISTASDTLRTRLPTCDERFGANQVTA